MAIPPPRPTIAAPNFPLFVVAYGGWATAVILWAVRAMARSPDPGGSNADYCYLLIPVLILAGAPWVGRAQSGAGLVGRSIAVHVLSPIVPCILVGIARASDPGFTGHGGFVLMIFLTIPSMLGLGLLGGLSAWGAMGLLRGSEAPEGGRGSTPGR